MPDSLSYKCPKTLIKGVRIVRQSVRLFLRFRILKCPRWHGRILLTFIIYFHISIMSRRNSPQNQVNPVGIIIGAVVIMFIVGLFNSIHIVQPGNVGIVIRLGSAQEQARGEGVHFIIPLIDRVQPMDIRILRMELQNEVVQTNDLQTVEATIVVNHRVERDRAVSLFREVGVRYPTVRVEPTVQEGFRAVAANFTAEELITERADVSQKIRRAISEVLEPYGVIIEAVNITHFEFSDQFNEAIELKVREEQRLEQARIELERFKVEAEQEIAKAEGEAEAFLKVAQAEAEALGLKKEFATMPLIWLTAVERWDGIMPTHLFGTPPVPVFETQ